MCRRAGEVDQVGMVLSMARLSRQSLAQCLSTGCVLHLWGLLSITVARMYVADIHSSEHGSTVCTSTNGVFLPMLMYTTSGVQPATSSPISLARACHRNSRPAFESSPNPTSAGATTRIDLVPYLQYNVLYSTGSEYKRSGHLPRWPWNRSFAVGNNTTTLLRSRRSTVAAHIYGHNFPPAYSTTHAHRDQEVKAYPEGRPTFVATSATGRASRPSLSRGPQ